jgi:hypothetical protein
MGLKIVGKTLGNKLNVRSIVKLGKQIIRFHGKKSHAIPLSSMAQSAKLNIIRSMSQFSFKKA